MNGISTVNVRAFFRWYFSQIPFITADPADIDQHFFGFNYDEKIGGEATKLKNVIAGLSQRTHTGLEGNLINHGSAMGEPMWLDIPVLKKVTVNDFAAQEEAFDTCKTVLNDFVSWATLMRRTGGDCDYPILQLLDLNKVSGAKVTNAGGSFYGWSIRIYLHVYLEDNVSFDPVTAPPLFEVTNGSILVYLDGKWTPVEPGTAGQVLKIVDDIPAWITPTGKRVLLTAASFTGNDYTNALLLGLVPQIDFNLYTNEGSGVLLLYGDGYSFSDSTGTISAPPQKYLLEIY